MRRSPKEGRLPCVFTWVALVSSAVVGVGKVVEGVITGRLDAIDVWPFAVGCFAMGDLLKRYGRERAARTAQTVASVLLAVVCLWMGGAAVRDLALGRGASWFGLTTGVLGILYVAVGAALFVGRYRKRRTAQADTLQV
ncbi:hypothetical protein [Streptomyces sp. NPDC005408]|uniref:hypothetical protein n=1 Tax=Streptomyces sp. NPDC005408 TaxID=3155341 RepID=UPI0033B875EA